MFNKLRIPIQSNQIVTSTESRGKFSSKRIEQLVNDSRRMKKVLGKWTNFTSLGLLLYVLPDSISILQPNTSNYNTPTSKSTPTQ